MRNVNPGYAVLLVLAVWLCYLTVKVAQHVHAWPFK